MMKFQLIQEDLICDEGTADLACLGDDGGVSPSLMCPPGFTEQH